MNQPYQPLYLENRLVGWTLPDLNQIEERRIRVAEANKMTKLLHAMSDPHYRAEDIEIDNYAQAIARSVYDNRNQVHTYSPKPITQTIPDFLLKIDEKNDKNANVIYIEPHIPRTNRTDKLRTNVRESLRKLVEDHIGPTTSAQDLKNRAHILEMIANYHQNQNKDKSPVQIPLHDYVVPPGTFERDLDKITPQKPHNGVIEWNTEIGPNNGNKGVQEFYMKKEQYLGKTGIDETC